MQQLQQARATVDNFLKQYNAIGYSTLWNAMATCLVNADGSLFTADGSPNNAHVIDTRVAGLAGLQCDMAANNLVNGAALLLALDVFFTGSTIITGTTNTTTSVTALSSTALLSVGMGVSGAGIPAGATITAINSATAITLSAAATASATVPLTFTTASPRDGILNLFRAG
jgi:hypothetical protein